MRSERPLITRRMLDENPLIAYAQVLEARLEQIKRTLILQYKPHQKQYDFHALGAEKPIRAFFGGNRTGKTVAGGVETALHATGMYPDWWPGVRWHKPTRLWVASETNEVCRDVAQKLLLGQREQFGTGILPGDKLGTITMKRGVSGAADLVKVKHVSGGWSEIGFKAYDQGRRKFQGTSKHFIWNDEEPPKDVFDEEKMRIMDAGGQIINTMTPLEGMSDVCELFLDDPPDPLTGYILAMWSDNPHLAPQMIAEMEKSLTPHEREARQYGKPTLGAGKIYPFTRQIILVQPFKIPKFWPRCAAIDFAWNMTAVVWGARDPDSDTVYLYNEHYMGEQQPVYHAEAIRARGERIPIVGDPAGRQTESEGQSVMDLYRAAGVNIIPADNAVSAGIHDVYQRMMSGRLRVFSTLNYWFGEYDKYHRDAKGKVVKKRDHLMDATRYLIRSINMFRAVDSESLTAKKPRPKAYDDVYGGF
jgi:phage terminase large subunit-like protein